MQLPGTKEQIWATLIAEAFNYEVVVDRLLNGNFATNLPDSESS